MKAYVLHGINDIRYTEVPQPTLKKNEVLIKVYASGICGSDIPRIYKNGAHKHPIVPGHEFAGIVEEVADDSNKELIGKRMGVFPLIPCMKCRFCLNRQYEMCSNYNYLGSRCDGAFAEYVSVPVWNLIEIPQNVSFCSASMLEPLSVATHSMRAVIDSYTPKDTPILVWGAGSIGLMLLMLLKADSFTNVYCVTNKLYQTEFLVDKIGIGKEYIFEAGNIELTDFLGADICFECVGKNESINGVIKYTLPKGKVMLVGNPMSDICFSRDVYWKILRNQLTVKGTWNSSFTKEVDDDWHYVLNLLKNNIINPDILISHKFVLSDLYKGFELMRDKSENYVKCLYYFYE